MGQARTTTGHYERIYRRWQLKQAAILSLRLLSVMVFIGGFIYLTTVLDKYNANDVRGMPLHETVAAVDNVVPCVSRRGGPSCYELILKGKKWENKRPRVTFFAPPNTPLQLRYRVGRSGQIHVTSAQAVP